MNLGKNAICSQQKAVAFLACQKYAKKKEVWLVYYRKSSGN